jgi:hypothetical protein
MYQTRFSSGNRNVWSRTVLVVVLAALLAVPLALLPEGARAQGPDLSITFYLHNVTQSRQVGSIATLRIMDTTMGTVELNNTVPNVNSVQDDWYLYPTLANDTTLTGTATMHMWALRTIRTGDSRGVTMTFRLEDYDATGAMVATIASGTLNEGNMINDWKEYAVPTDTFPVYTVLAGHSVRAYFELNGNSANYYQLAWGDDVYRSRVDIRSRDYMELESLVALDFEGVAQSNFPSDADDKDVTFHATVVDPFGGYDVRAVWCTLTDPDGAVIMDHVPMVKTAGFFNTYRNEYSLPWNYDGFQAGPYNLTVDAVDDTGWYYRYPDHPEDETFGGHLSTMTITFWIGELPVPVTVSVVDGYGVPLEGALVSLYRWDILTDATGNASMFVPNGTHTLTVWWQDVAVNTTPLLVSGDMTVDVTADVWSPTFTVVDDALAPVVDAVVFVVHPNGTQLPGFWRTDAQGSFSLARMAGGDYQLRVLWRGVDVFGGAVSVHGTGPFTVGAQVYTLEFEVVDNLGVPLELAQVVVANTSTGLVADSRLTGLTGNATSRLPVGAYDITVYWRNERVFDGLVGYLLDSSDTLVLHTRVYTISINVVDSIGTTLDGAFIIMTAESSQYVLNSGYTDLNGDFDARTPGGAFDLAVYWRDILVNLTLGHTVTGDVELQVVAAVFWVDVSILDDHGEPVAGALVTFTHSSGQGFGTETANVMGAASYRLPVGLYAVDVVWEQSPVYRDAHVIDHSGPLGLSVAVHYLEMHLLDSKDVALGNATVELWNSTTGRYMARESTPRSGIVTFKLPEGAYSVLVTWEMAEVHRGIQPLGGSLTVTIRCRVYYLDLHVVDTLDLPLSEALVELWNASSGRWMGTDLTSVVGYLGYRLPVGTYSMLITWSDSPVHRSTTVVDHNIDTKIVALVYYVRFHAVDGRDADLVGAMLEVANATTDRPMGTRLTNTTGSSTLKLPIGSYLTSVTWMDTNVFRQVIRINSNDEVMLHVSVFYVTFHMVDGDGLDLPEAILVVTNASTGAVLGTGTTPTNGALLFRLPHGPVSFTVKWMSIEVNATANMAFEANMDVRTVCKVWYLTVHMRGSDGVALRGAKVIVERGLVAVAAATTDSGGLVVFKLPYGPYTVNMTYKTTYYLSPIDVRRTEQVDLDSSKVLEVKLSKDEYPIPFYRTNLFAIIMAFVITFVVLILVFYYVLKKREQRYNDKAVDEEKEEEERVPERDDAVPEAEDDDIPVVKEPAGPSMEGPKGAEADEEEVEDEIDRLLNENEDIS